MLRDTPLDPIAFAGGSILLLPGGRCIVQLDELPEDASDVARDYANRYLAVLGNLGHTAYVGSVAEFGIVREAHRD
jgi:hypothetical protein